MNLKIEMEEAETQPTTTH